MLRKLIRHEFKATWQPMLLMLGGLIAMSGLARLFILLIDTFVKEEAIAAIFSTLISAVYMMVFSGVILVVLVFFALRFYNHLYSAEGYLTLMLPVPRWQHLFTKTVVSVIWYTVSAIAAAVSVLILFSFTDTSEIYVEMFSLFGEVLGEAFGLDGVFTTVMAVLSLIVNCIMAVLTTFCAISIGQLFKRHRVLGAALGYFCINTVSSTISSVITIISSVSMTTVIGAYEGQEDIIREWTAMISNVTSIVMLAFSVITCIVLYMITNYILKRAVNLQ